jgi:hypothetical protein
VPANNLGPYLDRDLYQRAQGFYQAKQFSEALEFLESLEVRYFVTSLERLHVNSFAAGVHFHNDGSTARRKRSSTGRLRLVAEGPPNGRPFRTLGPRGEGIEVPAYKLFELVEGAVFVAETKPKARASAELTLTTPLGRIPFRVFGRADASGRLELRVPYPSESPDAEPPMVHALGKWRIKLGSESYEVAVTENDVREGREVRIAQGP